MTARKATAAAETPKNKRAPRISIQLSPVAKQNLVTYCLHKSVKLGRRIGVSQGLEEILLKLKVKDS